MAKTVREVLCENLIDVEKLLRGMGLRHFLFGSNVLGYARNDKGFLADEEDIDVGIFHPAPIEELQEKLKTIPFKIYREFGDSSTPCYEMATGRISKVDFVVFELIEERGVYRKYSFGGADWDIPIPAELPRHLLDDLLPVELEGIPTFMPNPIEEYLVCHYGSNWRIPDPSWRWWTDSPWIVKRITGWRSEFAKDRKKLA